MLAHSPHTVLPQMQIRVALRMIVQLRQQTWRCGRFETAVQVRRTWMLSTVTKKR